MPTDTEHDQPEVEQNEQPTQRVSERALAALRPVLAALQGGDRHEVMTAWMSLQDPATMTILADGWRDDEGSMSSVFSVMSTMTGQVQRTRNLRRAVVALAEDRARRQTAEIVSRLEDSLGELTSVATALGASAPPTPLMPRASTASRPAPRASSLGGASRRPPSSSVAEPSMS